MTLFELKNRALLIVDMMQFFIFLFEVEDIINYASNIAVLLIFLSANLSGNSLSYNWVLQTIWSYMSWNLFFLITDLLLWNWNYFLGSKLSLLIYTQSSRIHIPILLLLALLLSFFD